MVARRTFRSRTRANTNLEGLVIVLKSAVCEWILLFFLILDAAFSYLLTKFAQYCELPLPCILCSRLDHVLGKEKPEFYRNLLCNDHKSDISSLVSCQIHGRLSKVHGMCEECLLSFVGKNNLNEETFKLLLGKLGLDHTQKDPRSCSCCNKKWRSRPNVQKLFQSRPVVPLATKPDIPLPRSPGRRCLNRQEGLKKRKDRFSVSTTPLILGSRGYDTLSHIGYTELKISSDPDSDFPLSDDNEMTTLLLDKSDFNDGLTSQPGLSFLPKKSYHDSLLMEHTQLPSVSGGDLIDAYIKPDVSKDSNREHVASNGDIGFGLREINWQMAHQNPDEAKEKLTPSKKLGASGWPDPIFRNNVASSMNNVAIPVKASPDVKENGDIQHPTATAPSLETNSEKINTPSAPNHVDQNAKEKEANVSNGDIEPEDLKVADTSSSTESQPLTNPPSMESSPSVQSLDTETVIQQLKQQVENDKTRINNLYKELEEERNAAAIAANQAMAMITKLQEEKSALHMEALQYLRMMEEQAEYDVDELEKANDLLAEKEKVIQDLEAELEYYRIKYPEEFLNEVYDGVARMEFGENSNIDVGRLKDL